MVVARSDWINGACAHAGMPGMQEVPAALTWCGGEQLRRALHCAGPKHVQRRWHAHGAVEKVDGAAVGRGHVGQLHRVERVLQGVGGGVVHVSMSAGRRGGACQHVSREEGWCMSACQQGGGVVHVSMSACQQGGGVVHVSMSADSCVLVRVYRV
jgi:hypothetical protein